MVGERPPSIQLIDRLGNFNESALDSFVKAVKLAECGLSYAVVSIIGPQSSGKSTLLNHLFHTDFKEMDAYKGRSQTTQGVWISKAVDISPKTLVMDLEGTDARERGEDETAFEKQSALFSLAVCDIVLINMWCHDIGREQAANKPLLKTVFQVMMQLFTPCKLTLLFVIRDKTKTPLEVLEQILREDMHKIWDSIPKPTKYAKTPLSDVFNIEITALPNYEEKEAQFKKEVAELRQRFMNSITPGGLAGDRRVVVPGSGFALSLQEIWKVIKENKDLDLPAHKVMVATVRCEAIAHEELVHLAEDQEWKILEEDAKAGPVAGLGKKLNHLLNRHLSRYDAETVFFDEDVRTAKRNIMLVKALEMVYPTYQAALGHLRSKAFSKFKQEVEQSAASTEGFSANIQRCSEACMLEFDQGCADAFVQIGGWESSKIRDELRRDVDAHANSLQSQKLAAICSQVERHLEEALSEPVASLLNAATLETWPAIRRLLTQETTAATVNLSTVLIDFELDKSEMINNLQKTGIRIVEKKAREMASQALTCMKDRFTTILAHDVDSMPRVWNGKEDMKSIIHNAHISVLKLLSTLAVLRLEDKRTDAVESTLTSLLPYASEAGLEGGTVIEHLSITAYNVLASSTWEGVAASETLITPVQCLNVWRQFTKETEYAITQAIAAQAASKGRASWLPPAWAIVAMLFLGLNELMLLLRNPLYIVLVFVLWLLGRAAWVQLDIGGGFQDGFMNGVIHASTKLLPTFKNFLHKLTEGWQYRSANQSFRHSSTVHSGNYTRRRQVPMQESVSLTDSNGNRSMRHRQAAHVSF